MRTHTRFGGWITVALGALAVALLGSPQRAAAQLSSPSATNSGSSCTGGNNSDGFCGSSAGVTTNTGTTIQTRYAWNVNADVGPGSTRDESGTAQHNVSFNAIAPGSYQLAISNNRTGMVQRNSDIINCDGQAHMGGASVSSNVALSSGSLTLGAVDVNNGGGDSQTPVNQTANATILRISNNSSFTHNLTITWNGSVRSNSCEAAVRLGQQNGSTSGCGACEYPGSPSRTQSSDGNFVTVVFTSFCGNGSIDGTGEACDQGANNGTPGSCCNANCTLKTNGTACTDDGNVCTNDTCNGSSPLCQHPNNAASCTDGIFCNGADTCSGGSCSVHAGNPCPGADGDSNCSESCNEAADNCTLADPNGSACTDGLFCNGTDTCSGGACATHTGDPCPGADGDANCSESCNEAADNCTLADPNGSACTGNGTNECSNADTCSGGACNNNNVAAGTACTDTSPPSSGNCKDAQCNGSGTCDQNFANETNGTACVDGLFCNGTDACNAGACTTHTGDPCPGADGDADCSESCNEAADNCLAADPNGSACTGNGTGECTAADTCAGGACSNNDVVAGTSCTDTSPPSSGDCNDAQCNGTGACDQNFADETNGSACDDSLFCNGTDSCTGGNCSTHTGDPCVGGLECADVCNEAADDCNTTAGTPCTDDGSACTTDTCDGAGACTHPPGNAGATCRAAAGTCDVAETCDGVNAACPADSVVPAFVGCRPAAGDCDLPESCDGVSPACPADVKSTGVCRPSAGDCDVAESCDGVGDDCPTDSVVPAFVGCRPSAGDCDLPESCDGVNPACPPDAFQSASTVCRLSAGDCDVAENCTGSSASCPADAVQPSGTTCRASTGACDAAETCDGSTTACPADALAPSGTVCRAAADVCDVAETCTGLSNTCPPDVALPNGTLCNDGSSCTTGETCQGGVCTGTTNPDGCADDFLCYKAKSSQFSSISGVTLADQFETATVQVVKPKLICPPANKDGEGIIDSITHLQGYQIKQSAVHVRRTNVLIDNQLGQLRLDTIKPDLLLVPAAKDLTVPVSPPNPNAHNVDHYKCYKAKVTSGTPKFPKGIQVTVADQFTTTKTFDLKKPKHLCNPVDKNGEGIKNNDVHLVCYLAKPARGQPKHVRRTGVNTNNQFGPLVLSTIKESELCIPSLKTP
jgi:hypothetical protein